VTVRMRGNVWVQREEADRCRSHWGGRQCIVQSPCAWEAGSAVHHWIPGEEAGEQGHCVEEQEEEALE
jgi:hypothetical protein